MADDDRKAQIERILEMTRQIKAIKASPQPDLAPAPQPDTAADIYQSFTDQRHARAFSELLQAAPPEVVDTLRRPGAELSPDIWHNLADSAGSMGQSRKGSQKSIWAGLERRLRNTAMFVEKGGARPDVLSVIPGATLPETRNPDPFGFAEQWTGRAEQRGIAAPASKKPTAAEVVKMAGAAAGENLSNTVNDILSIMGLAGPGDKVFPGIRAEKPVLPLKTQTVSQEAEASARESQDVGQNLAAGAIQFAPYLLSKLMFPVQVGLHPETALPMIKDAGTKIVDILKLYAVGTGSANMNDPAVRAEVEKSAERLRREPIENIAVLGMAVGLPTAGGRFIKGFREGGRLVEGEGTNIAEGKTVTGGEGGSKNIEVIPEKTKPEAAKGEEAPTIPQTGKEAAPASPKTPEAKPKQPWELKREEYLQAKADEAVAEGLRYAEDLEAGRTTEGVGGMWTAEARAKQVREQYADRSPENVLDVKSFEKGHELAVEAALVEGRTVPSEVLAEYPELAAKYTKKAEEKVEPESTEEPAAETVPIEKTEEKTVETPQRRPSFRAQPAEAAGEAAGGAPADRRPVFRSRAAETATVEKPVIKQPWEMTRQEFIDAGNEGKPDELRGIPRAKVLGDAHENAVTEAVQSGKSIPPEVLADYPDLAAKYKTPPPVEPGKETSQRRPTFRSRVAPETAKEPAVGSATALSWESGSETGKTPSATRRRTFSRGGKPPESTKPPVETTAGTGEAPKPGEILGLSNAESERLRTEYKLDDRDPVQRKAFERSFTEAKERGHDVNALGIADEVISTKRPITDAEFAGLNLKARQLHDGYNAEIAEASRLREAGNNAAADLAVARADNMMGQFERVLDAADIGGSEVARSLGIRRMGIKENYTVASMVQQAQARSGRKITAEERAKFEKLAVDYAATEAKLTDLEAKYQKAIDEQAKVRAESELIREKKKAKITFRASQAREKIAVERADIKKQLVGLGYRLNDVTGVTAEASYLIGKLAVTYIKEGVLTLDEIVRKVMVDVPGITERDVWKSLNARNPKLQEQAKSETAKEIARLKTRARLLVDLEKAEQGIFDPKRPKPKQADDIKAMQDQLRKMREDAYKSVATGAKLERAIAKINELKDMLDGHYRTLQKKEKPIEPSEVKEARDRIAELKKMLAVEDDIADLSEQIRTGEYVVRQKPEPRAIPPELERMQIERKRLQDQVEANIRAMEPVTVRRVAREIINTPRTALAAGDVSAVGRQGYYSVVKHPFASAEDFGRATRAMFSKYTADQVDNQIRTDPEYYIMEKAKLYLPDIGDKVTKAEENFMAKGIQDVPVYGDIIKGSERHYVTFLNLTRTRDFKAFLHAYPNATSEELAAWANYVNVTTGRGDLGKFQQIATTLSTVFFAPRFAVSRIQTPYMLAKYWNLPRVRNQIALDLARFSAVQMATLGMAQMAGGKVGTDPQDADFGKIVVGNQHIDIGAGFMQPFRLLARTGQAAAAGAGIGRLRREFDLKDAMLRFMEGKFSPAMSIGVELYGNKVDPFTRRRTFRNFVGEKETISDMALRNLAFMTLSDVYDIQKDAGAGKAALLAPLVALGVGVSTYDTAERERVNAEKDLKADLSEAVAKGDSTSVKQAYKEGKLSRAEYRDLMKQETDAQKAFAAMSIEKAMEAYETATDEVKAELKRAMTIKIKNWMDSASREDRERLGGKVEQLLKTIE